MSGPPVNGVEAMSPACHFGPASDVQKQTFESISMADRREIQTMRDRQATARPEMLTSKRAQEQAAARRRWKLLKRQSRNRRDVNHNATFREPTQVSRSRVSHPRSPPKSNRRKTSPLRLAALVPPGIKAVLRFVNRAVGADIPLVAARRCAPLCPRHETLLCMWPRHDRGWRDEASIIIRCRLSSVTALWSSRRAYLFKCSHWASIQMQVLRKDHNQTQALVIKRSAVSIRLRLFLKERHQ